MLKLKYFYNHIAVYNEIIQPKNKNRNLAKDLLKIFFIFTLS